MTSDPRAKERIASILVSIGDNDPAYFRYLITEAERALNSDMPWPTLYDKQGNRITKAKESLNPAFVKWCKAHSLDPMETFAAAYYEIPLAWYDLAAAGDPRAYSLLIKGLGSENKMIATWSAWGLAKLRDPKAVTEIIAAVREAPIETHDAMAKALLFFSSPEAQTAADSLILDKAYLTAKRSGLKAVKNCFPTDAAIYRHLSSTVGAHWGAQAATMFDAQGQYTVNHQISPTYNVYENGILVKTVPQSKLEDFISLNAQSQLKASDIK